jgi:hypothetical protein
LLKKGWEDKNYSKNRTIGLYSKKDSRGRGVKGNRHLISDHSNPWPLSPNYLGGKPDFINISIDPSDGADKKA